MNERDKELDEQAEEFAKQAWMENSCEPHLDIQKFSALIRADERERIKVANAPEIDRINTHIKNLEDAVKNEREACAKVCESHINYPSRLHFAEAIRARGNT